MDKISTLFSEVEQALQDGCKIKAGFLLNEILQEDFNNNQAWKLLRLLSRDPGSLSKFKRHYTKKYFPEKTSNSLIEGWLSKTDSQKDEKVKISDKNTIIKDYFSLNQEEIRILLNFTRTVFYIIFGFIMVVNISNYFFAKTNRTKIIPVTSSSTSLSSRTPLLTPTPILYSGLARRYVPLSSAGMPADFSPCNISESTAANLSSYLASYCPSSRDPDTSSKISRVDYKLYLFYNLEDAVEFYKTYKEEYESNGSWTYYTWKVINDVRFNNLGEFFGIRKEVNLVSAGRIYLKNNIVAFVMVSSGESNNIADILKMELNRFANLLIDKLP